MVGAYVAITGALLGAGWLVMEFGIDSWFGDVEQDVTQWFEAHRSGVLTAIAGAVLGVAALVAAVGAARALEVEGS